MGWQTLQRVILPNASQMDTAPLYMDMGTATGIQLPTIGDGDGKDAKPRTISSPTKEAHVEDFLSRHSTSVRSGERVSFGTYFNAFPASYWRRWTTVDKVRLQVRTQGAGSVIVYKSNARGSLQRVDTRRVEGISESHFELSLAPFGDGGWYWFDLLAGTEPLIMLDAEWQGPAVESAPGSVTLQITTLNKTDFCLNNLRLLADSAEALAHVQEILIVDQGTQKLSEAPGFDDVKESLAGKLRIINQSNLGGSGGFARGMFEAVENGSDYVLLMDDDIVVEPESITRLLTFADRCKTPTLVGGHMFDLYNRTVLHTFGEVVNPYRFQPSLPTEEMILGHDFLSSNLRQTSWLHRRCDVDYNGWWMCLIPTKVIRDIGLSLPVVHQVGRRRIRLAGEGARVPYGLAARICRMARVVDRQGRPGRLASLLPLPEPRRDSLAPQPLRARRATWSEPHSTATSSTWCPCSTPPRRAGSGRWKTC